MRYDRWSGTSYGRHFLPSPQVNAVRRSVQTPVNGGLNLKSTLQHISRPPAGPVPSLSGPTEIHPSSHQGLSEIGPALSSPPDLPAVTSRHGAGAGPCHRIGRTSRPQCRVEHDGVRVSAAGCRLCRSGRRTVLVRPGRPSGPRWSGLDHSRSPGPA